MDVVGFHRRAVAAFLALALAACQTGANGVSPLEHYRGILRSGCAPNDAPSIVLELQSATGASTASFNLWPSSRLSIPSEVRFGGGQGEGMATYCVEPGACQSAERGEVRLFGSPGDATIRGDWRMGIPGRGEVRGTFEADWPAIQALCG